MIICAVLFDIDIVRFDTLRALHVFAENDTGYSGFIEIEIQNILPVFHFVVCVVVFRNIKHFGFAYGFVSVARGYFGNFNGVRKLFCQSLTEGFKHGAVGFVDKSGGRGGYVEKKSGIAADNSVIDVKQFFHAFRALPFVPEPTASK